MYYVPVVGVGGAEDTRHEEQRNQLWLVGTGKTDGRRHDRGKVLSKIPHLQMIQESSFCLFVLFSLPITLKHP